MNNNIIILAANFGVGLLLIIIVAIVHYKKRKKNEKQFLKNWPLIEGAISENNISDVCYYSEVMLWNPIMNKANFEVIIKFLEGYESKYIDQIELLESIEKLYDHRGWNAIER